MNPKEDIMRNLATLRDWAASRHGAQRYGDHPYRFHLDMVAAVAEEFFPGDTQLQEGSYGHDLIEDTDTVAQDMLDAGFNPEAVLDVVAVTDVPAPTRKEKKTLTLPLIRKRGISAIKLKLCDRIANVRYGKTSATSKNDRYRDEQAQLEAELYDPAHVELEPMWKHLRELLAA
jgi:(p)ppGpp synthase/HD superfamily hydrolase